MNDLEKTNVAETNAIELVELVETLCADITTAINNKWEHTIGNTTHDYSIGKKYIRVFSDNGSQRSVWGFINVGNNKFKVGDVLKASGWSQPALNSARGNLYDGYEIAKGYSTHRVHGPDYLI
jgi:hypothetical protein